VSYDGAIAQMLYDEFTGTSLLYLPEYASHSQKNLALDHHSVIDAYQQILNEMNKPLPDKPAQ